MARAVAVPSEWRNQLMRSQIMTIWTIFGLFNGLQTAHHVILGEHPRLWVPFLSLSVVCAWGVLIIWRLPRVLEVVELLVWCWAAAAGGFLSTTSPILRWRHRTQMLVLLICIVCPVFSGMRQRTHVVVSLWTTVCGACSLYYTTWLYNESIPHSVYITMVGMCFSSMGLARVQLRLLSRLYRLEQGLIFEKEASVSLVSMFCDASCWLAEDGDTITCSDHRFMSIMGRPAAGQSLKQCLVQDDNELARLETALAQVPVEDTPVPVTVLPTSLQGVYGSINVDLYLVGRRLVDHTVVSRRPTSASPGYLIGIRLAQAEVEVPVALEPRILKGQLESRFIRGADEDTLCSTIQEEPSLLNDDASMMSIPASVPSTTASAYAFRVGKDSDPEILARTLAGVRKFGAREHWLIDSSEVKLCPDRIFGAGGYGVVVRGVLYGAPVAVKLARQPLFDEDLGKLPQLCNELQMFRRLRHPNLVVGFGAVVDLQERRLGLILEVVQGGDLEAFMRQRPRLGKPSRFQIITGVCRALWYLHSRRPVVVHGDLKSQNVLVTTEGANIHPKVSDFGISRLLTKHAKPLGGTLDWVAPEVFQNARSGPKPSADVFSFGQLTFFVATGVHPLKGLSKEEIVEHLRSGDMPPLPWPGTWDSEPDFRWLVEACVRKQASRRPSMQDVHGILTTEHLGVEDSRGTDAGEARAALAKECSWHELIQMLSDGTVDLRSPSPAFASGVGMGGPHVFCRQHCKPDFALMQSRMVMVLQLLHQWKCEAIGDVCCDFHAGVQAMEETCMALRAEPCDGLGESVAGSSEGECS